MKKIMMSVFLLFLISSLSSAQSKIGKYKWNQRIFMKPCTLSVDGFQDLSKVPVLSAIGQQFLVVEDLEDGNLIIKILDYTTTVGDKKSKQQETTPQKKYEATSKFYIYNFNGEPTDYEALEVDKVNSRDYDDKQLYFKVPITSLDYAVEDIKIAPSLSIGVITHPFKYRPQRDINDFTGSVNFGGGIGLKFPHKSWKKFTYSVIGGFSVGNVVLDTSSITRNKDLITSVNNFNTFSASLGFLVEYQERVQINFSLGTDVINDLNQDTFGWKYNKKMWWSIGIGYDIFSQEKPSKNQEDNAQLE